MKLSLQSIRNRKGFTLVELMIVVAIIGILAAIAIPAFLRSVKKSKTAEAESIMKKASEGAKAYFTSEQKSNAPTNGIEPWHEATATAPAGYPVPWASYKFPGGPACVLESRPAADPIPAGGTKEIPLPTGLGGFCDGNGSLVGTNAYLTLNKLGVTFKDPLYFRYRYSVLGAGSTASAIVLATANFDPAATGAADDHTITQSINIAADQEVQIAPPLVTNEFE